MTRPLLAATCDGVGTKLIVAREAGRYEGLGQDLVAMSVNDLLPLGARPLLFLDYIATGALDPDALVTIVKSIAAACLEVGCALLGGETAEMPGLYAPGDFDLAGFAVGTVDQARLPDPSGMKPGDLVLGLPSTGAHSNGFSLARKALFERARLSLESRPSALGGASLADALLEPTALYVNSMLTLTRHFPIRGAAHVTGGGLVERGRRLVGDHKLVLDPSAYATPPIFELIQHAGDVAPLEMARTFNMGLGFLVAMDPGAAREAVLQLGHLGFAVVGKVAAGPNGIDLGYASA